MDTLPSEMIFEIVSHLHGDEMVKFSMVNKEMYVDQHNAYYNEYGEELLDDVENIQIRCLSCFRKISLVDHYEHQLCDECMNGVIDHEFDRYDR